MVHRLNTRATLIYFAMMLLGSVIVILSTIYPEFSLDLRYYNASTLLFNIGCAVSIMGLHEVCHCLYCDIRGIPIIGIVKGWRDVGIMVEPRYSAEVRLSSLFSIPIATIASLTVGLPLWIVVFNLLVACIYPEHDLRSFLKERRRRQRQTE